MSLDKQQFNSVLRATLSRRRQLQGMGLAIAIAITGGAGGLSLPRVYATSPQITTDIDIVNFV